MVYCLVNLLAKSALAICLCVQYFCRIIFCFIIIIIIIIINKIKSQSLPELLRSQPLNILGAFAESRKETWLASSCMPVSPFALNSQFHSGQKFVMFCIEKFLLLRTGDCNRCDYRAAQMTRTVLLGRTRTIDHLTTKSQHVPFPARHDCRLTTASKNETERTVWAQAHAGSRSILALVR